MTRIGIEEYRDSGATSGEQPLVSIIIPLYNGARFIESTLASVAAQTYRCFEVLVIDDGSTDGGPSLVESAAGHFDGRLRLMWHPDRGNHGIAATRNAGVRAGRGSFVAFLDQDDLWMEDKLRRQVAAIEAYPEAGFVYGRVSYVDSDGAPFALRGVHTTYGRGTPGPPRRIFGELVAEDVIPNQTVLIRRSCFDRKGLLEEGPSYEYEDWLLLSKLAYFHKALYLDDVLASWRIHDANHSARIFHTGRLSDAEEHCTVSLFSFLLAEPSSDKRDVRRFLRQRIRRLFLRARSWGAGKGRLEEHMRSLMRAFPEEELFIRSSLRISMLLPASAAAALRRARRWVMGT